MAVKPRPAGAGSLSPAGAGKPEADSPGNDGG